ncbi:MAG: protein kinase [Kofleriaceae bacterium]|nr:protein kinase [Kofleriaceae bacterium]
MTQPTLLADRFELGSIIGEGSWSVVLDGRDVETGARVAIKLASGSDWNDHWRQRQSVNEGRDDVARRFEREAAALSVISSDHVVKLVAAGATKGGRPYLVLERLEGRTLQALVDEHGTVKPSRVVRYVSEAAKALELAHGVGIVHRDLKPANLFLHALDERTAITKVLDFGMVVDTAGPTERLRDAFGGTPMYMAPEQVRGQLSRIGPATDIWALAHVVLALLTGESYWTSANAEDVLQEIESSVPEKPSLRWRWLPDAFDQWFLRSTQRVPERRFGNVAEQAAQLAVALHNVRSPDSRVSRSELIAALTLPQHTPTPSSIRLAGVRQPVIGRQLEYRELERLLAPGTIVTLTGPAGIGKTVLAQAVCEGVAERFIDGTWFTPLETGEGEEPVLAAIATRLGIAPDATRSMFEHVVDSLAPRRTLIVLDGAEHVLGCAEIVERLRRRCPATTWLVTSRLALGLDGERVHAIEPLDLPRPGALTADEAETYGAVELFVRSARATTAFTLDDSNVHDVVAICREVEGFPLGIVLAAGQLASSSIAQIRAALQHGADAGARVRHAVTWSYGLLPPDQRRMLRQLAVLPAGLTFEQAKRRLAHLSEDPMYGILRLVKTHLAFWSSDSPRRLQMLDTVRELCWETSYSLGEQAALWQVAVQHADAVADASVHPTTEAWLTLVDAEHANLRAVLAHLLDVSPTEAMRLAGRLAYHWYLRGNYAEGMRWLETAIGRGDGTETTELGSALHGAGRLALLMCQYAHAEELLERARRIARTTGDARSEANADQLLGSVARERGDYARAKTFHRRSLVHWMQLGDHVEAARARNYLVFAAWLGDAAGRPGPDEHAWWHDTTAHEVRSLGDPEVTVWLLLNRGAILHHAGDPRAREVLGQAFAEAVTARFHEGIAWSLDLIGKASLARGELLQARAQLAASLRVHRRLGDRWRCASVLEALASVALASERPARAIVYLGAAEAIRGQIGAPVPACERAVHEAATARARDELGDAFGPGRERGRRTPLDQIIELARDVA